MRFLVIFDGATGRGHSPPHDQSSFCKRNAYSKIVAGGNLCGRVFVLLLCVTLGPFARAQRVSYSPPAPAVATGKPAQSHDNRVAIGRRAHTASTSPRSSAHAPYSSLPFPFFGDFFNPSDIYSTGYPVASDPPTSALKALQELFGSPAGSPPDAGSLSPRDSKSSQPLVIELQGGRYVAVNSRAANGEVLNLGSNNAPLGKSAGRQSRSSEIAASPMKALATKVLPAVVLVFRDGHKEEVRDYAIIGNTLYLRGDYYTDGYWNKKIELSSLDLAQTQRANLDRSVKFVLPSSPNEVITRP